MKVLIVGTEVGTNEIVDILRGLAEVKIITSINEDDITKEAADVDAIILRRGVITKKVMDSAKNLKVVGRRGVGVDNVDLKYATEKGIYVTYAPGINSCSVVEHTFALMLMWARHAHSFVEFVKDGKWGKERISDDEVFGLHDNTLGIIGLGSVGSRIAKVGVALDMRVIAYDPFISSEKARQVGAELTDLDYLLSQSDYISINIHLTADTKHFIGEKELKKMKKNAFLINTSRGEIIDEDALIKALSEKWIAGAALDVVKKEPINPDNPFLKMDNVLITPHIGGASARLRVALQVGREIERVLKGGVPQVLANPEVLKRS